MVGVCRTGEKFAPVQYAKEYKLLGEQYYE